MAVASPEDCPVTVESVAELTSKELKSLLREAPVEQKKDILTALEILNQKLSSEETDNQLSLSNEQTVCLTLLHRLWRSLSEATKQECAPFFSHLEAVIKQDDPADYEQTTQSDVD